MNSKNKIYTRSKLAEAILIDPSKKADFSRAWEASKYPEAPKKTATVTNRTSAQELAKSIELALESQIPFSETAATTKESPSINLAPGSNVKPNFVDPSNDLVSTDHLDPNGSVPFIQNGVSSLAGTKDLSPTSADQNQEKGPLVENGKKPEFKVT